MSRQGSFQRLKMFRVLSGILVAMLMQLHSTNGQTGNGCELIAVNVMWR